MCLIAFAWRADADFPLVVVANRDEYLDRPAMPAHWWQDAPDLLAGRDLEAGGTWMGVTRSGRFAALTNYRDPSRRHTNAPSRGALVRRALEADADTLATLRSVAADSVHYAGFNLLVSDGDTMGIHESTTGSVRLLGPGVYGLSNHLLDTPWPKLTRARSLLAECLPRVPSDAAVLALLRDRTVAADEDLPRTGVSLEWERLLSPTFIQAPGYGTRCSSLVTMDREGRAQLSEWTWDAAGELRGQVRHDFRRAR
ncbi:MAG: NRDE family protein [Proteobacteria bacterium]|nr:NRDE family protein [Pseudomonadota bacterium]